MAGFLFVGSGTCALFSPNPVLVQQIPRVAKLILRISTVIARSSCDDAIHCAAYAAMDCFAHRTALCAEPVARNDGLKIPHVIGAIVQS